MLIDNNGIKMDSKYLRRLARILRKNEFFIGMLCRDAHILEREVNDWEEKENDKVAKEGDEK